MVYLAIANPTCVAFCPFAILLKVHNQQQIIAKVMTTRQYYSRAPASTYSINAGDMPIAEMPTNLISKGLLVS